VISEQQLTEIENQRRAQYEEKLRWLEERRKNRCIFSFAV
jgi:hypothetical protein